MSEGQVVEHGDSLRMHKQAQGGCVAMLERERKIAIRLLITGSGRGFESLTTHLSLVLLSVRFI